MLVAQPVTASADDNLLDDAPTASCARAVVDHFQFNDASISRVDKMVDIGIEHSLLLDDVVFAQVPSDAGFFVFSVLANSTEVASWIPVL